ncbi:hypothetical protein C0J50_11136, partial [Silurus asotus]
RFRATTTPVAETPSETYNRLRHLYRRWVRPELHTKEEIGEMVILEQFLRHTRSGYGIWVKEREPRTGLAAAKLAQQYRNAHQESHRFQLVTGDQKSSTSGSSAGESRRHLQASKGDKDTREPKLICYYCQQPGHKARKAKLTGFCYVPRKEDSTLNCIGNPRLVPVTVNGKELKALLDTGSSMSLVKRCHVTRVSFTQHTKLQCVHGEVKQYPQTKVNVSINGQTYLLTVAVVETLPADVILGRDVPVLPELVQANWEEERARSNVQLACPVVTRAQAKMGLQPLPDMDSSLLQGGTKGPRKSRRQHRLEKGLGTPVPEIKTEGLEVSGWTVPVNIVELQRADESLTPLFEKARQGKQADMCGEQYVINNNILYMQASDVTRRPTPVSAHDSSGRSLYTDVQKYCTTCPTCQQTSAVRQRDRPPLQPLPVISVPFQRIAMDIVGPLEKSSTGYQYILVISDYATRYPEAFPLRSITTPKIINALIQLFSRVGIPEEILTDQGTNFTSGLMKQLHRQLGITAIKTSPYHSQTDGLVERFNKTLKGMLRKFVSDTERDWDKWLPFLLFAYREVPQASTGFSPFELLYGWQVQGPLDLLRRNWEDPCSGNKAEKGIVQYILEMRDRLENYRKLAAENLQKAQKYQKTWYDQQARSRELQPGQKVLLLLPTSTSKLLMKWQGPYSVVRRMGQTSSGKSLPAKKADPVLLIQKVEEDREEDHPEPKASGQTQPAEVDLGHLEALKQAELQTLFGRYPALFRQRPGRTNLVHHKIRLTNTTPSRQRPYRVPERLVAPLKAEVRTMLEMGVIETSSSEWSSPVVIVPKKDNTLRICIDFRRLMPRIDDLLENIGGA